MKETYPNYRESGVEFIREKLSKRDNKILQDFLNECGMTAGKTKLKDIERTMLQIRDIIEKPYGRITRKDVVLYAKLVNQSEFAPETKRYRIYFFKRFLKWYFKDLSLIEGIRAKSTYLNEKRINENTLVTAQELELMIRTAESLRLKALVMLLYESGCRPQEIRLLKWKDIKFNDDVAEVSFYSGKTESARTIPLKESNIHLQRWKQEYCYPNISGDDYVFPAKFRDKPMVQTTLSKAIRSIAKKSGIQRPIYPYLFRHSRLTTLYKELPNEITKKFAGHSKRSQMPSVYSHISSDDVKKVMLEKIYHVEEITQERQHELEKQVKYLGQRVLQLVEIVEKLQKNKENPPKITQN